LIYSKISEEDEKRKDEREKNMWENFGAIIGLYSLFFILKSL
jgi:hypothetical protein